MGKNDLEKHFGKFRKGIIGIDQKIKTPFGKYPIIYADWIASGRLYEPIERKIAEEIGPYVGNTHSESSETGMAMTHAYHKAHQIIKQHVNADQDDVIITAGFGMTSVLAKFQRILGLKVPENLTKKCLFEGNEKPVIFITHMEHHSNHTTWLESLADVVVIPPDDNLMVQPEALEQEISKYKDRKLKLGSFSACSNVTGIETPYHELAEVMHRHNGYCFVDFAASAPYVQIDMHPKNQMQKLDAIFFSPHKFLGGPGSSGVLIFCKSLYKNRIPDHPGGGTVTWTNPWGEHAYIDDIEIREDGGTPGFLQAIRTAFAIRLKEQMGVVNMRSREEQLVELAFAEFRNIPGMHILADNQEQRLGVFSFYIENIHHNMIVRLLNDRFGIQVRGGCSCAGTYGHFLLNVDYESSHKITSLIDQGDLSQKPGWVRISLHPTTTDKEIKFIAKALRKIVKNHTSWSSDYDYSSHTNEYHYGQFSNSNQYDAWFDL